MIYKLGIRTFRVWIAKGKKKGRKQNKQTKTKSNSFSLVPGLDRKDVVKQFENNSHSVVSDPLQPHGL